jgi:hypothetical protein
MLGDIGKGGFMSNAYNEFIEFIGSVQQVEPSFFIAKISNPLPNLKITLEGIELDKDDFLISKSLLMTNNAQVTCSTGNIQHNLKDVLSVGDNVLLVKVNNLYIVVDKVVNV